MSTCINCGCEIDHNSVCPCCHEYTIIHYKNKLKEMNIEKENIRILELQEKLKENNNG